jgi:hygromycin-B 7''-O-kinase
MLPHVTAQEKYFELWKLSQPWEAAKREVCQREGLDAARFTRQTDGGGSHIVWLDRPRLAIKLHSPLFPDAPVEQAVLRFMEGRLSVETPRLVAQDEVEGWPYTVSTFVPGVPMRDVWPGLDRGARVRVARQLGEVVREWHDVSAGHDIIGPGDWRGFLRERMANAVKLQEGSGLSDALARQIPAFLEEVDESFTGPEPPVLLHTDFRRVHLMMSETAHGWRITGLIDVGDSMMGHREYDLIKATHAAGPPARETLRALFAGYGPCEVELSREGSERMMRWSLLHFDTPVAAYFDGDIATCGATTLSELSALTWPL